MARSVLCSVKSCIYNHPEFVNRGIAQGIIFYSFPRRSSIKEQWVSFLNEPGFQPNEQSRICSLHFIRECFVFDYRGIVNLKMNATPTKYEFYPDYLVQGPIVCRARYCTNNQTTGPHITFYPFPLGNAAILDSWTFPLGLDSEEAKDAILCNMHFEEICFVIGEDGQRYLKDNAIPTLFLEFEDEVPLPNRVYQSRPGAIRGASSFDSDDGDDDDDDDDDDDVTYDEVER